jgi:ABC-type sugar transport system ATPase subunit
MAQVVLSNVSKAFSGPKRSVIQAVVEVDLTVAKGEFLTLVGPSGCGKTTLLRLIAGLESPDVGTIALHDEVVNQVAPQDRDVAMGFQRDALFPHLTASENLALGMKLRGVPAPEIRERVDEIARTLAIGDCLARLPGELSSGQRQRVALGRALVRRPQVLLLDEPFANLDAPLRRELRGEVLRLQRERQLTVILVTHDQSEALAMGQRVAVMRAGKLEQVATPAELRAHPATPFVAEFLNPAVI